VGGVAAHTREERAEREGGRRAVKQFAAVRERNGRDICNRELLVGDDGPPVARAKEQRGTCRTNRRRVKAYGHFWESLRPPLILVRLPSGKEQQVIPETGCELGEMEDPREGEPSASYGR